MCEEEAWGVVSSCIVEDVGGREGGGRGRRGRIGRGWGRRCLMSDEMSVLARCYSLTLTPIPCTDPDHPYPHVQLISLVPISLVPKAATAGILLLAPSPSPIVLHGKCDRNVSLRPMQSQGSLRLRIPPPHQRGSVSSHSKCYTVQYAPRSLCLINKRPVTKHISLAKQIPDVKRIFTYLRFPGPAPPTKRPTLFHCSFFSFVYCFVSCLPPWLTICPP